jgi:hypothetical protein
MWLLEKKIFHHILDLGYEGVAIPVRVKFEFEIREGKFVPDSLKFEPLYNKDALLSRYPNLNAECLDKDIVKTVEKEIHFYLESNRYLRPDSDSDKLPNRP